MPALQHSPYSEIIAAATGAGGDDLAIIEDIMRNEIFHSTLDWQSRTQLENAARKAAALLEADREFYVHSLKVRRLTFEEMRLTGSPPTPAKQRKLRSVRTQLIKSRQSLNQLLS